MLGLKKIRQLLKIIYCMIGYKLKKKMVTRFKRKNPNISAQEV